MRNSQKTDLFQTADEYLTLIEDAVYDLDRLSAEELDDLFASEVYEIRELVKRARRQLL